MTGGSQFSVRALGAGAQCLALRSLARFTVEGHVRHDTF